MESNKTSKVKISEFGVLLSIMIFCFSFLFQSQLNPLSCYGNSHTDSSVFRVVAEYIKEGRMPYKDTFDHKGPLLYILNFIGISLADYKGIWLVEFVCLFIALFFMYKIARLRLNKATSLISIGVASSLLHVYFQNGNLTEEYALPFIAISLFIFIDYFLNNKITCLRLIACGFCFAAVCLLRINMVSLWIAFCIAVLVKTLVNKQYKELRIFILYFILGIIIIVLPIMIWLFVNDAFMDFIDSYFVFNTMYISEGNATYKLNKVIDLINKYFEFKLEYITNAPAIINKLFTACFFMVSPLTFVSFVYLVIASIKNKNYLNIGYLVYFLFTIFLICIGGRIYPHYGMIIIPLITYPIVKSVEYIIENFKKKRSKLLIGILGISFICFSFLGVQNVISNFNSMNNQSDEKIQVAKFIKQNSDEDSKITVFGNENIIYLLSERMPASKYSYQLPIGTVNPDIMDEYFYEIGENQPEFIVVCEQHQRMYDFLLENEYSLEKEYSRIKIYKK